MTVGFIFVVMPLFCGAKDKVLPTSFIVFLISNHTLFLLLQTNMIYVKKLFISFSCIISKCHSTVARFMIKKKTPRVVEIISELYFSFGALFK